ncbi:TetR/AcrR family transcriptional regulator [Nocardioides sp.]|uniref:TetR/AcrR family transcriptional regulator n=1 Tax=Nocardioides sp. TaxID=35761 RepID=UPI0035173AF5
MTPPPVDQVRPRIEGDREQQILDAALAVLVEVGYDRLTMDAVATAARASKATLYRRWNSKAALVSEALVSRRGPLQTPDTGSLRGDLVAMFCGPHGMTDGSQTAMLAAVLTAVTRDEEFATEFRARFLEPKLALATAVFRRAQERGEVRADLDTDLIAPLLPSVAIHRHLMVGLPVDEEFIARVVDEVVLPLACPAGATGSTGSTDPR